MGNVEPSISWTGNSFHVFFFLDESKPNSFYEEYFMYSKHDPERNFTGKWTKKVDEQVEFKVAGGHEMHGNSVNIDPLQTPSGKLMSCSIRFTAHERCKDHRRSIGAFKRKK